MIFSTPTNFFHQAEKTPSIPETAGEIPHAWANILSSIIHLLPPAIAATDTLVTAEKFAAINYALGYAPYPQQEFEGPVSSGAGWADQRLLPRSGVSGRARLVTARSTEPSLGTLGGRQKSFSQVMFQLLLSGNPLRPVPARRPGIGLTHHGSILDPYERGPLWN